MMQLYLCAYFPNRLLYSLLIQECDGWNPRDGTEIDRNKLQATFRSLNFKVITHEDRTKSQILKEILPAGKVLTQQLS